MRIIGLSSLAALALAAGPLAPAHATVVPAQRGNPCSAVWDTGTATASAASNPRKPWTLQCGDGDTTCDTDGQPNGSCSIVINGCAFTSEVAGCTPEPLTQVNTNGVVRSRLIGFVPIPTGGTVAVCGNPGTITLPLRGKNRTRPSKPRVLVANFRTASGKGKNALRVQCVPAPVTAACPRRDPATLPFQITFTVPPQNVKPSDLDTGVTGTAHNQTVVTGAETKYCLTECDGQSDTSCVLTGGTGAGSLNGTQFGAPLPLISGGVPVCVVNLYQDPTLQQEFDIVTGRTVAVGTGVNLFSDVYVTANPTETCPRCVATGGGGIGSQGRCSNTARNPGAACRVESLAHVEEGAAGQKDYTLSTTCLPPGTASRLDIRLPLTTETAMATTGVGGQLAGPLPCRSVGQAQDDQCGAGGTCVPGCTGNACFSTDPASGQCLDIKGGISQLCCSSNTSRPCFPTRGGGTIVRTGEPIVPGGAAGAFAALFCIPPTDPTVNAVAGLPGPGALILPATAVVQ